MRAPFPSPDPSRSGKDSGTERGRPFLMQRTGGHIQIFQKQQGKRPSQNSPALIYDRKKFLKYGVVREIAAAPPLSSSGGSGGLPRARERARKHSLFSMGAAHLIGPPSSMNHAGGAASRTSGITIEAGTAEKWPRSVSIRMLDPAQDTSGICSKKKRLSFRRTSRRLYFSGADVRSRP